MTGPIFIFYVADQEASTEFYRKVLAREPKLNVPGMTEFDLDGAGTLGLMPISGIKKLLGRELPDPERGAGVPRAELYLRVENAPAYYDRALRAGAKPLSSLSLRNWGESVAYCLDPDGQVLAFAERGEES